MISLLLLLFLLICAAIRNISSSFMQDLFIRRLKINSERTWHVKKTIEFIGKISQRWFATFPVYRWLPKRSFLFDCLSFLFAPCLQKQMWLVFWYFLREEWFQKFHPSATLNRGIYGTHRKGGLIFEGAHNRNNLASKLQHKSNSFQQIWNIINCLVM